jgi:aminoglycoside/choline kinase family phosphotransferase
VNSKLIKLFETHLNEKVIENSPLKAHGSDRKLFRIRGSGWTAIGAENSDRAENIAFLEFSRHFRDSGLPVPEIYAEDLDSDIYLEEDLGEWTLFDLLVDARKDGDAFPERVLNLYKKVVRVLPEFQMRAGKSLNYDVCYPRSHFDRQSMMWDLNYFKYYFLKLARIPFNEQALEDDFQVFTDFLLQADQDYFLYRDFQSRNIMIQDDEPFFIDYQGGRKGALQYDIASLLYDAKADLPFDVRDHLLETYLDAASKFERIDHDSFLQYFYGFVLVRIMQAMGAYGFRGFYERKTHFLQSVPFAIRNLEHVLKNADLPGEFASLTDILQRLVRSTRLRELGDAKLPLSVSVKSFSYKEGLPTDETGHGGGFIFDCRALPNPGRLPEFAKLTGRDREVIDFLEDQEEVHTFLMRVRDLVSQVVDNYSNRNFTHLEVAFGCTGGQHRSVYCANLLAKFLSEKYQVRVLLSHRELDKAATAGTAAIE